jgi:hypothetical protein
VTAAAHWEGLTKQHWGGEAVEPVATVTMCPPLQPQGILRLEQHLLEAAECHAAHYQEH